MWRRPSRRLRNLFCMEENVDTKWYYVYKPVSRECFPRLKASCDYRYLPSGFAGKTLIFYNILKCYQHCCMIKNGVNTNFVIRNSSTIKLLLIISSCQVRLECGYAVVMGLIS